MNSYKVRCSQTFSESRIPETESAFLLLTAASHRRTSHLSFECKRMHAECAKKCREFLTGKYDNSVSLILLELCALGDGSYAYGGVFALLMVSRSTSQS